MRRALVEARSRAASSFSSARCGCDLLGPHGAGLSGFGLLGLDRIEATLKRGDLVVLLAKPRGDAMPELIHRLQISAARLLAHVDDALEKRELSVERLLHVVHEGRRDVAHPLIEGTGSSPCRRRGRCRRCRSSPWGSPARPAEVIERVRRLAQRIAFVGAPVELASLLAKITHDSGHGRRREEPGIDI